MNRSLPNKTLEPASAAAALAAQGQRRWAGMTPHVALLSMVFGVLWHTIVVLLMGRELGDAGSLGMLAGALAGLCAGFMTIRSRQRHHGRESILDGIVTYYLAVVIYALASVGIGVVVDAFTSGSSLGALGYLAAAWVLTWYAVLFASLAGVVLVPLCFLTRRLLWQFSRRMRPNEAQQRTAQRRR